MSKIKTRESVKDIKVIDKASVASQSMKTSLIRSKGQAENLLDDGQNSPSEYAEDKIQYAAEDVVNQVQQELSSGAKNAVQKGRDFVKQRREVKHSDAYSHHTQRNPQSGAMQRTKTAHSKTIKSTVRADRTVKQTAKSTGKVTTKTMKGSIKTSQKAVKTANTTQKAAIKTTQVAAETAAKAAQATTKAAQAAVRATRAAAKAAVVTAKAVAKATAVAVKAIIAGVKALIAVIAVGGWVAVVVIVVICLIALIVGSCFGIFFSGEDTGGQTMSEVVQEINADYDNQLEGLKSNVTYDVLEMSGSRAVWREVLSIYAVKTTTDPDNPQEVASMNDEKKQLLKNIFWEMNQISSHTDTKTEIQVIESDDGHGNIVETQVEITQTYLYITVEHKTANEMASNYSFTPDQMEQLSLLLSDENNLLWMSVLYGVTGSDDQIVAVAQSQLGNIGGFPYWSWYGFGSRVEWCACFVSWCANECEYIENGIIPKYAGCLWGVQWFKERGQWADNSIEPTPGMIIFFDWDSPNGSSGPQDGESDHTGIVEKVENGRVYTIEGNSGDSCRQKSYPVGYYEILGYGIPAY